MKQVERCFAFLRELGGKPQGQKRVRFEVDRTENFPELGHLVSLVTKAIKRIRVNVRTHLRC